MHPFIFHLLRIIVTMALVTASAIFVLHYYFRLRKGIPASGTRSEELKIILPLRLQAYERIILFLERIHPSNLLLRVNKADMAVIQLQSALIRTIREEFEYNLSQQLYISPKAWELVKNIKEETIKMIHIATGKLPETAPSAELVRIILEEMVVNDKLPADKVLQEIKREIQSQF